MAATIRRAVRNDAPHVAALMDMAGHGIEAEYWALNRDADGSILAAARQSMRGQALANTLFTNWAQPERYCSSERGFDMDYAMMVLAVQGLAVVAGLAWCARTLTRKRSYRASCRVRLREAPAVVTAAA